MTPPAHSVEELKPMAVVSAPAAPASIPLAPIATVTGRVGSIDAYRGLVMLLMMGEVLQFTRVARALPQNTFWSFLAHHQTHAEWVGCSLHDLIQPSFSFLVGVAMPFSLARRSGAGQPEWRRTLHAFWRALALVLLGVFLRSIGRPQTYWTFEDTLSQIGLGYGFLYLLSSRSRRVQWLAFAGILAGYWLAFALYPLPGPDFDWARAGARPDSAARLSGFAAHWNLNSNFAWAFDTWFMNLFPREASFTHNNGGYSTLSFIPTLGTMLLGLLAGEVLRGECSGKEKVRWMLLAGVIALAGGWALGVSGVCPVVKRIWTSSWVLFSGGWCFFFLAAFYWVMDIRKKRAWAYWLTVVGTNSIAAYLIAHLFEDFIRKSLLLHTSPRLFEIAGHNYQPLLLGSSVLVFEWIMLWWMYRRKVFLRL